MTAVDRPTHRVGQTAGPVPSSGPAPLGPLPSPRPVPPALQDPDAARHGHHRRTPFQPRQTPLARPAPAPCAPTLKAQFALATLCQDLARCLLAASDPVTLQKAMGRVDGSLQQALGRSFLTGVYSGLQQSFGHLVVGAAEAGRDPKQLAAVAAVLSLLVAIEAYPPAGTLLNGVLVLAGGAETVRNLTAMVGALQQGDGFGAGQAAAGALLDSALTAVAAKGCLDHRGHWRQLGLRSRSSETTPLPSAVPVTTLLASDVTSTLSGTQMVSCLKATIRGLQEAKQALKAQYRHALDSTDHLVHTSEVTLKATSSSHVGESQSTHSSSADTR